MLFSSKIHSQRRDIAFLDQAEIERLISFNGRRTFDANAEIASDLSLSWTSYKIWAKADSLRLFNGYEGIDRIPGICFYFFLSLYHRQLNVSLIVDLTFTGFRWLN